MQSGLPLQTSYCRHPVTRILAGIDPWVLASLTHPCIRRTALDTVSLVDLRKIRNQSDGGLALKFRICTISWNILIKKVLPTMSWSSTIPKTYGNSPHRTSLCCNLRINVASGWTRSTTVWSRKSDVPRLLRPKKAKLETEKKCNDRIQTVGSEAIM